MQSAMTLTLKGVDLTLTPMGASGRILRHDHHQQMWTRVASRGCWLLGVGDGGLQGRGTPCMLPMFLSARLDLRRIL